MKKFFLILIACSAFSCGSSDEELINDDDTDISIDGNGEDPCLNIYEYTFSSEGDSISVYSLKGVYDLDVGAFSMKSYSGKLFYSDTGYSRGYYGDWWYAACPDEKPYGKRVDIVVQPNDTGEERVVPIVIGYLDWGGGVGKFVQEK